MASTEDKSSSTSDDLLTISNLWVSYRTDEALVKAVNGLSLKVSPRETLGLVGETGAGKTTTALAVMGLLPTRRARVDQGEIIFDGMNLLSLPEQRLRAIRGGQVSMVFQEPMTSLNPSLTVELQIAEALEVHRPTLTAAQTSDRVDELLTMVGIKADRKKQYPHQFSGGMRQRVVIAIALACEPKLLIADEPTTALDVTIQAQVLKTIEELKAELGMAIMLITHDLGVVAQCCDSVAIMYLGEIVEYGAVADIYEGPLHHPYTTGLFGSIPDLYGHAKRLSPIKGLAPDPTDLPPGCGFNPRCPRRSDVCSLEKPPAISLSPSHMVRCHLFGGGLGAKDVSL
ncbi:MAG: ABC transporter ATP-binding protein [Deltaproteobacteria bacterium]|jgi:peptide/nickel transport system ATP-binding protein|nr:ABC transporter ATP-binding protein [Deltaproteobacteria bacterium]